MGRKRGLISWCSLVWHCSGKKPNHYCVGTYIAVDLEPTMPACCIVYMTLGYTLYSVTGRGCPTVRFRIHLATVRCAVTRLPVSTTVLLPVKDARYTLLIICIPGCLQSSQSFFYMRMLRLLLLSLLLVFTARRTCNACA